MDRRSTSAEYTHFGGDVTAQVNSSHGVRLSGGSTGGIVEAVGDDTNVSLRIRAQGAANINIGNSSQPIIVSTGGTLQLGSTAPFAGFIRFTSTAVATPDFNTTNAMVIESSVTITGVNSSHFIIAAQLRNNGVASTDMTITNPRTTSTNGEVLFGMAKISTVTVAASTATVDFLAARF